MMLLFRDFVQNQRAAVAITFVLMLIPILVIAGIAVDYSQANSDKSALQDIMDASVLAGASMKNVTSDDRIAEAKKYFAAALPQKFSTYQKSSDFMLSDTGSGVKGTLSIKIPSRVASFFGAQGENVNIVSIASLVEQGRQLDMAFCIDATTSMGAAMASVTANAQSLETNLNNELQNRHLSTFSGVRVRVMYFRDFTVDGPSSFVVSNNGEFWNLPDQASDFGNFMTTNGVASGGIVGAPDSGFVCLDQAINSHWAKIGDPLAGHSGQTVTSILPLIAVWTDNNARPIEDPLTPPTPSYYPPGVATSYVQLDTNWNSASLIDQNNKTLVFFGNLDQSNPVQSCKPGTGIANGSPPTPTNTTDCGGSGTVCGEGDPGDNGGLWAVGSRHRPPPSPTPICTPTSDPGVARWRQAIGGWGLNKNLFNYPLTAASTDLVKKLADAIQAQQQQTSIRLTQ
jgi:Flp pilus assembly protein TadG